MITNTKQSIPEVYFFKNFRFLNVKADNPVSWK